MNSIQFPNASRSFDESKNRVCFWGYDNTIEVSFYVGVEALQRIRKGIGSAESEILVAFDAIVDNIHQVATKVYANNSRRQGRYSCILNAEDF
jgi:hypothetical protein